MIETATVASQLNAQDVQGMQKLPASSQQDVMRFEQILRNGVLSTDGDKAGGAGASLRDVPVLKVRSGAEGDSVNMSQSLLNQVANIDESYKGMLSEFAHMPHFEEYMSQARAVQGDSDTTRSYPEVSGEKDKSAMDSSIDKMKTLMSAALDYQNGLSRWHTNSQMFIAKLNIIGSAVSQVSQGFKTLFRAAG